MDRAVPVTAWPGDPRFNEILTSIFKDVTEVVSVVVETGYVILEPKI